MLLCRRTARISARWALLLVLTACAPTPAPSPLRHLLAPCCWRETLDMHSSPLATELRAEVKRREAAGEPAERIEAALVARYGPRMRTHVPEALGTWLTLLVGLGGAVVLHRFGRRSERAPPAVEARTLASGDPDGYEAALDADLRD